MHSPTALLPQLEQLSALLDTMPVPAALAFDAKASRVRINAALAAIVGVEPHEYVSLTVAAPGATPYRFLRDGRPLGPSEVPFALVLAGLPVQAMRMDIQCVDGSIVPMIVSATRLSDDNGTVCGALAILQHIGAQIEATRLLDEIARLTPALLFTTDAGGRVTFVNERWSELIGAPAATLLGTGWASLTHPDDVQRLSNSWSEALRSGEPYHVDWRVRRADGTYHWVELRAVPERDASGAVRRWYGAGADVDAQRRALAAVDFLASSGATVASATDVATILKHMAEASLEGLADVSIFDLIEEDGTLARLVVSSEATPGTTQLIGAFQAPELDEPHPIARAIAEARTIHIPYVDDAFIERSVIPEARRDAWRQVGIRSLVSAPMSVSGKHIGALTLLRTQTAVPFETPEVRVVEEIARRAAIAVDNVRLNARAQREAEERERKFRLIADSMPLLMWTASATGERDWYNRRWYEYTGQTEEEARGWGWRAAHHPLDLPNVLERWGDVLASGAPFEMEFRLRGHDGVFRWFLTRATQMHDAQTGASKWYGTNTDIDDQKRAEQRLHFTTETIPQIIWTSRQDGTCDYVNRRWIEYTGMSWADSLVWGWTNAFHPEEVKERIPTAWRHSFETGEPFEGEYRIRDAEGAYRWFLCRASALKDDAGNILQWFGTATDVDERKRNEESMRFLTQASDILGSSLDVTTTLRSVAELATQSIADWCVIHLVEKDGTLAPATVDHTDPAQKAFAEEVLRLYRPGPDSNLSRAVTSGESVLLTNISPEAIASIAQNEHHRALLEQLRLRSGLIVALKTGETTLGALQLLRGFRSPPYTEADLRIAELLARRATTAIENARAYERERRVSTMFQHAALPQSLPEVPGVRLSAVYVAAELEAEIGGDWYDAFTLDDGRLVISIGDVAGKGLNSAVIMGSVRQTVRLAAMQGASPVDIFHIADTALWREYPGWIVTAFVAIIDIETMTIEYCSSGHPFPILRTAHGSATSLPGKPRPPLGVGIRTATVKPSRAKLAAGSLLVLFTDGLTESTRNIIEGEQRLLETVRDPAIVAAAEPAAAIRDRMLAQGSRDDVAILTVTV